SRLSYSRQLFDVVHQAVELPLSVDLLHPTQREAIQTLFVAQVGEHRFHVGEAAGDQLLAWSAIDLALHDVAGPFGFAWRASPGKIAACRTGVRLGWRRHCARNQRSLVGRWGGEMSPGGHFRFVCFMHPYCSKTRP